MYELKPKKINFSLKLRENAANRKVVYLIYGEEKKIVLVERQLA